MNVIRSAARALGAIGGRRDLESQAAAPRRDLAAVAPPMPEIRAAPTLTVAGRRRRAAAPKTPRLSAYRQAVAFLAWLQDRGYGGCRIEGYEAMERLYFAFARDAGVVARHWNPLSFHFGALLHVPGRPRRTYGWLRCELTGDRHRIRVYDIPPKVDVAPVAGSDGEQERVAA